MNELVPVNNTKDFFQQLEQEGKSVSLTDTNQIEAIQQVNTTVDEAQRLFQQMDSQSNISASNCVLNA